MTQEQKENYLSAAQAELASKRQAIVQEVERVPREVMKLKELYDGSKTDQLTFETMRAIYQRRFRDLQALYPSPYFYSCLVKFAGEKDCRQLYFAKFAFDQENIYSWSSPAAAIRFEAPGFFAFESAGVKQSGQLLKKDQYLITDGKIMFLATENVEHARELVFQEYFSTRKTAFVLPEIVAQMEKAQDQVVRAKFGGWLAVTGPAGSGKTTLALHRTAYLLQSPETADQLSENDIIVFVQDDDTKDYFSHLLPDLGIKNVEVITWASWARKILPLEGWQIRDDEPMEEAAYFSAKLLALQNNIKPAWDRNWFKILTAAYDSYLNQEQKKKLAAQKSAKIIDRFDLTILLASFIRQEGCLMVEQEYYQADKDYHLKRKKAKLQAAYKLMIIDEFQNYLPQQLALLKTALASDQGEMIYIGDFNQRVKLGTVRNWSEAAEALPAERLVKLSRVYRNTKEILLYLQSLGYEATVPEGVRSGAPAQELVLDQEQEKAFIAEKLAELSEVSVGLLCHRQDRLEFYQREFSASKNVRVMPLQEAQGVEFDTVFLAGVDDDLLSVSRLPEDLREEYAKIKRDLLYIALTRAMNGLYVLGEKKLSEMMSSDK